MYAIDFKRINGTPRLFLDFLEHNEPACQFFRHDFRDYGSYRRVAEDIDRVLYNREKLASILLEVASSLKTSSATLKNIAKLRQANSLCVFAGQQVGLLLGPMYTILKALSAIKLARRLESELGRPVIPCFWMASDDHDFDEVRTVGLLNRDGECRKISYQPRELASGAPMSDIVLDEQIKIFLSQIDEALPDSGFKEEIGQFLKEIYQPGVSISVAFAGLFERLMADFGIVPVDPNFPGLKELFIPIFRREITDHAAIFDIFETQSRKIIENGYHRQVHKNSNTLNLFFNSGRRRNITNDSENYLFDGQNDKYSKDELMNLLENSPDKFSANVTLRPIAQCYAFPTVCQIVGPSEAAYFAQIEPLFHYHGVPWPVVRPRLFSTLIEPHVRKIIQKLGIDFTGLINDRESEVSRVIKENFPPEIQEKAENLRAQIEKPLDDLGLSLKRHDPDSFQAIEHVKRRIDHELNHLSQKLFQAHKKKHDEARQRIYRVAAHLLPCGTYQERVITPIYFTNKYGPEIFKWLDSNLDLDTTGHQLLEINL
jgi:bacillithiol biosynthesis cysteine-adding enzyme BshC